MKNASPAAHDRHENNRDEARFDETMRRKLRAVGLKATSQRLSILSVLATAGKPLSLEAIASNMPRSVDLSTLYRNMKEFADAALVRAVDLRHGHAHYELKDGREHHHLVCTRCGLVEDFSHTDCSALERTALSRSRLFTVVTDHALEVYGVCKKCSA